jgi:GNAT superfamily N-acetyltransferase
MPNIRRASLGDLDALVHLRLELLREVGNLKTADDAPALAEATRRYLKEKIPQDVFLVWVAEEKDKIVGTSGLMLFENPPISGDFSRREAYITNMYTLPEWRGKGIATALLEEIIHFAKEMDARRLWLRATPAGRSVYEKAGFVPTPERANTSTMVEMELVW